MSVQMDKATEAGQQRSSEGYTHVADQNKKVEPPVEASLSAEADLPISPPEKPLGVEPPPNGGLTAWLQVQ